MQIHRYKSNGYNIILDVPSSSVHVADDLFYDACGIMAETDSVRETEKQLLRNAESGMYDLADPQSEITEAMEEMEELSAWVAGLTDVCGGASGRDIPLHVSRFFPRFHMTDRPPTDVGRVYQLAETARKRLRYVYTGNC